MLHVKGEVITDETLGELKDEFPIFSLGFAAMPYCQPTMSWVLIKIFQGQFGVRTHDVDEFVDVSRRHLPAIRKVIHRL